MYTVCNKNLGAEGCVVLNPYGTGNLVLQRASKELLGDFFHSALQTTPPRARQLFESAAVFYKLIAKNLFGHALQRMPY